MICTIEPVRNSTDRGARRSDTEGSKQIRVLLVIKGLGHGGAERLLVDMVSRGDKSRFDYEVAYILSRYDGLASSMRDAGAPVHSLGARADWDISWMGRLRALIRDGKFDVVHFHLPYSAALGRLVARSLPASERPKVVYTEHSQWNLTAIALRILNTATSPLDDALVVVSESGLKALPKRLRRGAEVIVHGIDLSSSPELRQNREKQRVELRKELGVLDGEILVLTVANLRAEKGYDVLLAAAKYVVEHGSAVRFFSVGHGTLQEELIQERNRLGLGDRFVFLGLRTDVLRLMAGADVFALASHFEGLPVTLMEATSVGMPIVATTVGEIPIIFTDGQNALLVPPGRSDLFAEALERAINDAELRKDLGSGALGLSSRFDVTTATRRVEAIYDRLSASK